jgi:hypothetical protein
LEARVSYLQGKGKKGIESKSEGRLHNKRPICMSQQNKANKLHRNRKQSKANQSNKQQDKKTRSIKKARMRTRTTRSKTSPRYERNVIRTHEVRPDMPLMYESERLLQKEKDQKSNNQETKKIANVDSKEKTYQHTTAKESCKRPRARRSRRSKVTRSKKKKNRIDQTIRVDSKHAYEYRSNSVRTASKTNT